MISALIVAAGYGRRFGSDKRVYVLDSGERMIDQVIHRYGLVFDELNIVVRHDDELAESLEGARIRTTENAEFGMGHSIADGVAQIPAPDFLFIALADMPFVRPETLQRLYETALTAPGDAIIRPRHQGEPGHPVGFARRYLPQLMTLRGDAGARKLLAQHERAVQYLDVADPGVVRDVDTPASA